MDIHAGTFGGRTAQWALLRGHAITTKLAAQSVEDARIQATNMSSVLYDFLNESILFDPSLIEERFASISEARLSAELSAYRDHCRKCNSEAPVSQGRRQLRLFAGSLMSRLPMLKQGALYLDSVVVDDPLLPLSVIHSDSDNAMSQMLGVRPDDRLDRHDLTRVVTLLRQCRPMVAAGYLQLFVGKALRERPEKLPIYHSETAFREWLVPEILAEYGKASRVVRVERLEHERAYLRLCADLHPCREICVTFADDDKRYFYALLEHEFGERAEEQGLLHGRFRLPDSTPADDTFKAWVDQSVNQAARQHFDGLMAGVSSAARYGSSYLTDSEFSSTILRGHLGLEGATGIRETSMESVLRLNLEAFEDVSIERLMDARADEEAFALFRREIEKHFRDLRAEQDPEKRRIKIENAAHELAEVQLTKVSQGIRSLRRRLAADAALLAVGLAGTVVSSGVGLTAVASAAALGFKHYGDYLKAVHENPAFFLWKAGMRR